MHGTDAREKSAILVIECGAAQTRAALTEKGEVAQIWFGVALGDEQLDQLPHAGRQFLGRVTSIDTSLNAAFVDLSGGNVGYLALSKKLKPLLSEGAVIGVEIKSPPRQGKGAVLKFVSSEDSNSAPLGRCGVFESPVIEAVKAIGTTAVEILVDDGLAVSGLRSQNDDVTITHYTDAKPLFEAYGVEAIIEETFERSIDLAGGGRLTIDETQALTAIDVDTAGLSASSPERLREKIAVAAAQESIKQIKRRNIGGHVVIDFPKLKSDISRKRFAEALQEMTRQIDGVSGFSFSKSGLFSMTVPHRFQSFRERFTEADSQSPIPGRQFTLEWQAHSALRKLEHRLRVAPAAQFDLRLGETLFNYVNAQKAWLSRLQERHSLRFSLILDETRVKSDFEISEQ